MRTDTNERLCATFQVLLAWGLEHGTSVIPKTTKIKNLKSNLEVLNWNLPSEDYKTLSNINPQANSFLISHASHQWQLSTAPLTLP